MKVIINNPKMNSFKIIIYSDFNDDKNFSFILKLMSIKIKL